MRIIIFLFLVVCNLLLANAQRPIIIWEKTFGGSDDDGSNSICKDSNGTYLNLGYSASDDGDITNHISIAGGMDYWLCRIDSLGSLNTEKSFGGSRYDTPGQIISTHDNGFVLCGTTSSNDVDVSGNHGFANDIWITKVSDSLIIQWQKCFGSTSYEYGYHITQTTDSGFVFMGKTRGNDSDVIGNHGDYDIWVGKIDQFGTLLWQVCLGSADIEEEGSVIGTSDGGVLVTGATGTGAGSYCSVFPAGYNVWMIKLDISGNIQWEKCLGSPVWDQGVDLISDGRSGYYVASKVAGGGADVSGYIGNVDIWILHLDSLGNILWQNCFGGPDGFEFPTSLVLTSDLGIIVSGITSSNLGQVNGNHGYTDAFIFKVDSNGNFEWSGCYGGSDFDEARSVTLADDGSIIFTGVTSSNDGDISFNHGGKDFWVVKLAAEPLSINDLINPISQLSVYFREDICVVSYSSKTYGDFNLRMFDLLGKEIFSQKVKSVVGRNEFSFDVQTSSGIKILQLKNSNSSTTAKVFVE